MSDEKKITSRGYMIMGLLGLVVLVGGFGSWSMLANISGAIIATGQVEVDQNRQVVQHPDGGVVAEISVDEGDMVQEGDLLLQLDSVNLKSELSIVESQLFEFMARRARLEAERDGTDTITFDPELITLSKERPEVLDLIDGQSRLFVARNNSLANEAEQLQKQRSQILTQVEGITCER